jgi:hypothetical protein
MSITSINVHRGFIEHLKPYDIYPPSVDAEGRISKLQTGDIFCILSMKRTCLLPSGSTLQGTKSNCTRIKSPKSFRKQTKNSSGCSAVRLAHLPWAQGVAGSNPVTPTIRRSTSTFVIGRSLLDIPLAHSSLIELGECPTPNSQFRMEKWEGGITPTILAINFIILGWELDIGNCPT